MRIGIDARFLGDGGGIARYVKRLVENLEQIDRKNEYVIFLCRKNWNEFQPTNPHFSKKLADIPWYGLKEQMFLPFIFHRAQVDLMHFPHWNIPLLCREPFVITIHDLILLHFSSKRATTRSRLAYFFKHAAYRVILKYAVGKAKHIITPSQFTKNDITRTLRVSPEKITVIYEGVDAPRPPVNNEQTNTILNAYGIQKPYILYVGVAYPHKNLEWLIKTMSSYNARNAIKLQIALVGATNYFYERIKRAENQLIREKQLILTGFVPDQKISVLFRCASAYVFPSLYEGFGLPPLQALAYETPVISSNKGSMPEILGDAALYFDPLNGENFRAQLDVILHDEKTRARLIQNGRARYQQFSWTKMAKMSLLIYEK